MTEFQKQMPEVWTLQYPVRGGRSSKLFYKAENVERWVCAVKKRSDDNGFLITATQRVARGMIDEATGIEPATARWVNAGRQ
jgi:hypothetical protein